jgi:SAM-dependent methyltransferase
MSFSIASLKKGKVMLKNAIAIIPKLIFDLACLGADRGEHVTRFYMYEHFKEKFRADRKKNLKVLSISGSEKLCYLLGFDEESIQKVTYPEHNILNLPFEDETFDAVVSDQVLEHVEGAPQAAIDETLRVLKHSGLLVHATCFINPIHGAPSDYWRFTPEGLSLLVNKKAEVIESSGWGNIFIWIFFALGIRYKKIPKNRYHPINWLARFNQKRLPVTTWVVAEKIKKNVE